MSDRRYETFEEFWPFYVRQHSKQTTRTMHFVGTTAALACVVGGLLTKRRWLLALAPAAGYGPAWVSHFFVEGNRPATFTYPVWSLRADLVMWWKTLAGTMDEEFEQAMAEAPAGDSNDEARVEPARPKNGAGRETLN